MPENPAIFSWTEKKNQRSYNHPQNWLEFLSWVKMLETEKKHWYIINRKYFFKKFKSRWVSKVSDIPGNLSLLSWSKLRSGRCWTSHRRDCKAPRLPRHSGGSIGPSVGLRTWKKTRYEYNNKKFCVMMLQSLKAHSYRVLVFCDKRSHIYNL